MGEVGGPLGDGARRGATVAVIACREFAFDEAATTSDFGTSASRRQIPCAPLRDRLRIGGGGEWIARWAIENEGFNELVTRWHGDHVYKHDDRPVRGSLSGGL